MINQFRFILINFFLLIVFMVTKSYFFYYFVLSYLLILFIQLEISTPIFLIVLFKIIIYSKKIGSYFQSNFSNDYQRCLGEGMVRPINSIADVDFLIFLIICYQKLKRRSNKLFSLVSLLKFLILFCDQKYVLKHRFLLKMIIKSYFCLLPFYYIS